MAKQQSEMTSYLNNGHDVMNYFAKFEKFLPHSIIIPSFMTIGSQMPELDGPYKLGLKISQVEVISEREGSLNLPIRMCLTILCL